MWGGVYRGGRGGWGGVCHLDIVVVFQSIFHVAEELEYIKSVEARVQQRVHAFERRLRTNTRTPRRRIERFSLQHGWTSLRVVQYFSEPRRRAKIRPASTNVRPVTRLSV